MAKKRTGIDANGDHAGTLTGNVTGNLTGNVTGNLTGNVTGNVTGDLTGHVDGSMEGYVESMIYNAIDLSEGTGVTLTELQKNCSIFEITTGHASNILLLGMTRGRIVTIINAGVAAALVKNLEADSAITVAAGKTAMLVVKYDESIARLTADV